MDALSIDWLASEREFALMDFNLVSGDGPFHQLLKDCLKAQATPRAWKANLIFEQFFDRKRTPTSTCALLKAASTERTCATQSVFPKLGQI